MTSSEVWLIVGAIGLYLFDSTLWLYSNELMFLRHGKRWRFAQSLPMVVAGNRVYFPNPLTPGTPSFKVRWSESDPRQQEEESAGLDRFFHALRPVKYLVNILLGLLLALPPVVFFYGSDVQLLVLLGAYYLVTIVTLGYICARRVELRLTGRSLANLCFDSLACAPFAINLVRKLALRRSLAGNPIAFAARSFEMAEFSRLIDAVTARVADDLLREDGRTARAEELEAYRKRLEAMVAAQQPQGRD